MRNQRHDRAEGIGIVSIVVSVFGLDRKVVSGVREGGRVRNEIVIRLLCMWL